MATSVVLLEREEAVWALPSEVTAGVLAGLAEGAAVPMAPDTAALLRELAPEALEEVAAEEAQACPIPRACSYRGQPST